MPDDLVRAEETAKDIINSIAERDIYTGDAIELVIVTKDGVTFKREAIRRDWEVWGIMKYLYSIFAITLFYAILFQ